MSDGCLSDWELFSLAEGDGSPAHAAHLRRCVRCQGRAKVHQRQIADVAAVLRTAPIPSYTHPGSAVSARWLLPVAAALVAVLLMRSWVPMTRERATSAPFLSEVSGLLFTPDTRVWRFDEDRNEIYVQAALRGDAPCELQHGVDLVGCY